MEEFMDTDDTAGTVHEEGCPDCGHDVVLVDEGTDDEHEACSNLRCGWRP